MPPPSQKLPEQHSWPAVPQGVQVPEAQSVSPYGQTVPHFPQFAISVSSFTQLEPQQLGVAAKQTTPPSPMQPPQLFGSIAVFVHSVPQLVRPEAHSYAQTPEPLQVWPTGQGLLQAPQLALSVFSFTQPPLQGEKPEAQTVLQWPLPSQV